MPRYLPCGQAHQIGRSDWNFRGPFHPVIEDALGWGWENDYCAENLSRHAGHKYSILRGIKSSNSISARQAADFFVTLAVPKAGLEPARVSPPPPQDGVSTKFHHFGSTSDYSETARLLQLLLETPDAKSLQLRFRCFGSIFDTNAN